MRDDRLIDRLASDLKPVRRSSFWGNAAILAALTAAELALVLRLRTMRPDMQTAMGHMPFWWKLVSLGLIALVSGIFAILSLHPARSPRRGLRWVAALATLSLAIGWLIDAAKDGYPALAMRLDWHDGLNCVREMVMLAIPAVIALGVLMRRGAPTDPGGTALIAGIAAAAWGAFVFVLACPFDDPLYIVVWYSVGCAMVTAFARLVLPPLTRW